MEVCYLDSSMDGVTGSPNKICSSTAPVVNGHSILSDIILIVELEIVELEINML